MDGNRLSTTRSSSSLIIIHSGSPLFSSIFFKALCVPKMGEDEWGARCLRLLDACRIRILSRKKKRALKRERESHLDCIQNQMRNVSNTLFG